MDSFYHKQKIIHIIETKFYKRHEISTFKWAKNEDVNQAPNLLLLEG